MKIRASKRDDILRDKAMYEEDKARRQSQYDAQEQAWNDARRQVMMGIKSAVESELGNHADEVNIDIPDAWKSIRVNVNNGNDPFGPHALSWSWSVKLDRDGNVVKDSGSWLGLSAVTPEQIQDLRNTADILEILNSIDWKTLLNTKVPEYKDYITMNNPSYEKPDRDYDTELKEADIEDIIGDEDTAVFVGNALPDYFRGNEYVSILKETPKRFTVYVFYEGYIDDWKLGRDVGYNAILNKAKFYQYVDTSKIIRR